MKSRLILGSIILGIIFSYTYIGNAQIPSLVDYSLFGNTNTNFVDYSSFGNTIDAAGPTVSIASAPVFPQPFQTVTVYIQDSSAQYTSTPITWVVNGKQYASEIGKTSIEIIAGDNGSQTSVTAILSPAGRSQISRSIVIKPTVVDMVWQAQSYTPPFYKGKALLSYQGTIKVTAIPTFYSGSALLKAENLVYTWTLNDRVLGSLSGYGKNTLELSSDIIQQTMLVSVVVSSRDNTIQGQGRTVINPQSPAIVVYENNPLYGTLYNQVLSSQFTLKNPEIGLTATPFFFSNNAPHAFPTSYLIWSINGQESLTSNNLTLRKPSSGSGSTNISIEGKGGELLQSANTNLTITFTNK